MPRFPWVTSVSLAACPQACCRLGRLYCADAQSQATWWVFTSLTKKLFGRPQMESLPNTWPLCPCWVVPNKPTAPTLALPCGTGSISLPHGDHEVEEACFAPLGATPPATYLSILSPTKDIKWHNRYRGINVCVSLMTL